MRNLIDRANLLHELDRQSLLTEKVAYVISTHPMTIPKVVKGNWIYSQSIGFFCDRCGKSMIGKTSEILAGEYKYCPRCGSKMEVK